MSTGDIPRFWRITEKGIWEAVADEACARCERLERELTEAREQRDQWEAENTANLALVERAVLIGEKLAEQREKLAEALEEFMQYSHDCRLSTVTKAAQALAAVKGVTDQ